MRNNTCNHRPAERCKHKLFTYGAWQAATSALTPDPDGSASRDDVRMAYLSYVTDRLLRPEEMSRQRSLVLALGGKVKGKKHATRYEGVRLTVGVTDSGYRAGGRYGDPVDAKEALTVLRDTLHITDRDTLNTAYAELSGLQQDKGVSK